MSEDAGKHYRYEYKGVKLDPYRIFQIYQITGGAQQHSIKKLLRAGRSIKPLRQDVIEARDTLNRWLEMMDEDQVEGVEVAQERMDAKLWTSFKTGFVGETKGPDTLPAKLAQEELPPIEYTPEHIGTGW